MVPVLLRQRSLHVEIPQGRGPLTARLTVPAQAEYKPARRRRNCRAGAVSGDEPGWRAP